MTLLIYVLYMSNYKLITDGAYSSKLDQGGLGLVFLRDDELILKYSKRWFRMSHVS